MGTPCGLDATDELRQRFQADCYLYLPGLLDRDTLLAARREMLERLDRQGYLDPNHPLMDGVARKGSTVSAEFIEELGRDNPPLMKALYDGPMMAFYERFLGGPVRHFDYTWCRVKSPGEHSARVPSLTVQQQGRG